MNPLVRLILVAVALAVYVLVVSASGPLVASVIFFHCDASCESPGEFQVQSAPYEIAAVIGGFVVLVLGVLWIIVYKPPPQL